MSLKSIITLKKLVNHPDLIHNKFEDIPDANAVIDTWYKGNDLTRHKLQPGL